MEIYYHKKLDSTQLYLIEKIKDKSLKIPSLIYTHNQTNGIGSRDNLWNGVNGNLFFSFVVNQNTLPKDLPHSCFSIYFGYIIKQILQNMHSKVYLKWPNDLYLDKKKIGGIITNKKQDLLFVGIGINLVKNDKSIHFLDINLNIDTFFDNLVNELSFPLVWKSIFKLYQIEFYKCNENHKTNIDNKSISLKDATLNDDGSITINNKKVYSLR